MIGGHFYYETLKSATAAFGTLFNNIVIKRKNGDVIPVPLSYGPRNSWLEASKKTANDEMFEKILPRMSYEMVSMSYDSVNKITNKQYIKPINGGGGFIKAPVPYIVDYTLFIQTKNLNDGWQIIEQILPFFTPAYTIRVRHFPHSVDSDTVTAPENAYDMPIVLSAVTWSDDYTGGVDDKRVIEWSLEFTTKIHLFGPDNNLGSKRTTVIYDARAIVTPVGTDEDLAQKTREDISYGDEVGYVSIDSDTVSFANPETRSPFVINTLTDSDNHIVRVIRDFNV